MIPGRLDEQIADELLAETAGNPLALLELPRGLTTTQLAGGFGLPARALVVGSDRGELPDSGSRRCPSDTQRLLLVAAAEPTGDPSLLWRAAERLGITGVALEPAESAGLIEVDGRVRFRHPLVRSAIYRSATAKQRRRVHQALAEATDVQVDPDRRAWHLAEAAAGPDEDVAAELERAAGRAQARGGLAAAAAFLERSAELTPEPLHRARACTRRRRRTKYEAGALDEAVALLATAETATLDDLQRTQVASASCSDCVRLTAWQRGTSVSPERCSRTGISRPESRAHDLSGGLLRGLVCGPAGPRRRGRRGRRGDTGGHTVVAARVSVRSSGPWVGDPVHRGLRPPPRRSSKRR